MDENRIGGAVALVLRDGQPAYERAVGWSDKEAGTKMAPTTVFRIASQTKAITSVAILSLMEEGTISLTDPVSRFIPSFAGSKVAVRSDTGVTIVPAKRAIAIRDLLTHTAGISYGTEPQVAAEYEAKGPTWIPARARCMGSKKAAPTTGISRRSVRIAGARSLTFA